MYKRFVAPVLIVLSMGGCSSTARQSALLAPPASRPATQAAPVQANFVNARAILIVRHGDIDVAQKASMGNAAPLTPRGQERARELAYALKDAGVTRIVTTEAVRTRETGAALARELNLESETIARRGSLENGMATASESDVVMQYLSKVAKPGDVILLVHHHSTLPSILGKFGYPREAHFDDATEFDRLYVIVPDAEKGSYRVIRASYRGPLKTGGT